MGILSGMEKRQRLENPKIPISSQNVSSVLGMTADASAPRVDQDKALGLTAFWAGVRAISQIKAGLPLQVYEKLDDSSRQPAPGHPVNELLFKRPNPLMSAFTFKEIWGQHLLTWGNFYAEIQRDASGRPAALWPLLPDRTGAEIVDGEKRYWTVINGQRIWLSADRVLHVPGPGYDGIMGYNVISMHRQALGLSISANKYGSQFFNNSGRPSGYITHPGKPDENDRVQLRDEWNQLHGGLDQAQRTAVLWGGMEWKAVSMPPEDAQFLQTREMQIEEVARILNINPILLQHFTKATTWGSGVSAFLIAFGKFTMAPWLERDEDILDWDMFGEAERGRYYCKYNLAALLRGDAETQAKVLEIKRRNGVINADEWRQLDEDNPLPDGQGEPYLVPLNMAPVSQLIDRDAEQLPSGSRAKRKTERRSSALRQRLRTAHRPLFVNAVNRYIKRDSEGLKKAVKNAFNLAAGQELDIAVKRLQRWAKEFYDGQEDYIAQTTAPVVESMAAAIMADALEEAGGDEMPDAAEFTRAYNQNLARREAGSSRGQVLNLIEETAPAELEEKLLQRADEWPETRPDKVADDEVVRLGSGAARFVFLALGVTYFWRANPGACPLCIEMDGRPVGSGGNFLNPGDIINPGDEDTEPLRAGGHIGGPPLHKGCVCDIET